MPAILALAGVAALLFGGLIALGAQSAIHEILAALLVLGAFILFGLAACCGYLITIRDRMPQRPNDDHPKPRG